MSIAIRSVLDMACTEERPFYIPCLYQSNQPSFSSSLSLHFAKGYDREDKFTNNALNTPYPIYVTQNQCCLRPFASATSTTSANGGTCACNSNYYCNRQYNIDEIDGGMRRIMHTPASSSPLSHFATTRSILIPSDIRAEEHMASCGIYEVGS